MKTEKQQVLLEDNLLLFSVTIIARQIPHEHKGCCENAMAFKFILREDFEYELYTGETVSG